MAGKKTKLEEGTISEILVADTDWESDAKASDVEGYFEEEKKRNNNRSSCRAQQKSNHRLLQVADYQNGDLSWKEHKYSSFCQSSKRWTMKLFFHLPDLTVLNSWILLSCGAKYTHRDFRLLLVRKLKTAKIAPTPDWL